MSRKWIGMGITAIGVFLLLAYQVGSASAQEPTPGSDENCVACHEHRYYLYDSGKWFCLCDAPMHCVYCHGGNPAVKDEELAHEGLVLHPTRNQAERCKACHTDDYLERVVTFGAVAGINPTPNPVATATAGEVGVGLIAEPPRSMRLDRLEAWRSTGLVLVGAALALILIFGYHCYKADCLTRTQG